MKSNQKIIQYYDYHQKYFKMLWYTPHDLAMHYGYWDSKTKKHSDALLNMNRALANIAKIKPTDLILDAGCGVGGSSIWLARNFETEVIGISLSQKQIDLANNFAKENHVDHLIKFYVRDFLDTKFEYESFDVVWAIESVCYAENKSDFTSEAWRILRKNGRLIVADGFIKKEVLTEEEQKIVEKFCNGVKVPNLAEIAKFKKALRESKFKGTRFFDVTEKIMPSSKRLYYLCKFHLPLVKILESFKITPKMLTRHILAGINQYYGIIKKIFTYGIFYAEK
jgi:tocopherol O-methyltransferase